jgi:hypothetical protein
LFFVRWALEGFYRRIVDLIRTEGSKVQIALAAQNNLKLWTDVKRGISMSAVDRLFEDPAFKDAVWDTFGFDQSCDYPSFPGDILYGLLSERIHGPNLTAIYLRSEKDRKHACFFEDIGRLVKKEIEIVDELNVDLDPVA